MNDSVRKYYKAAGQIVEILNYWQSVIVPIILIETKRPQGVNSSCLGLCT